jgi:subtilisin family serine protease
MVYQDQAHKIAHYSLRAKRAVKIMNFLFQLVMLTLLFWPALASASLGSHRKLKRAVGSQAIRGQYIIELDPSIPDSNSFAARVLKRAFRNNVLETYDYALKGFAVKDLPEMLLNVILNMDDVLSVSEDAVVEADTVQTNPPWGLDITDGKDDNRFTYTYTGQGVDVYVLDTGIQANHPDLEGRVDSCVSYTNEACGSDLNGHGTHVAGTVGSKTYGVAKKVSLHDVKVLDRRGSGSFSGVIAGIDYVAQIKKTDPSRKTVLNMSLGGGRSTALNNAVNSAATSGVVVVVAAGNSNRNACNYSPASASGALVVGSIERNNRRSSWSNWGSCVDIFAAGSGILSLSRTGGVTTKSGTSMAAPHVAGVAALYLQVGRNPNTITSDALKNRVTRTRGSDNKLVSTSALPSEQRPSRAPTQVPTVESVPLEDSDSLAPTKAPVSSPAKAPVPPPTLIPTRKPTRAPTRKPTRAPTKAPVPRPPPQCRSRGQGCNRFRRCCRGLRCVRRWLRGRGLRQTCRSR